MQADVDNILEMRGTEPETAPFELAEEIVLAALFKALLRRHLRHVVVLRGTVLATLLRERMPVR